MWLPFTILEGRSPTIILTITGDSLRHTDTSITVVNQYLQSANNVLYTHVCKYKIIRGLWAYHLHGLDKKILLKRNE